ncbi:MAG: diphthine synthase [Thermoplasmata archaeon]|nr:diphthine synthase [Thermoplasmata archaeon]
MGELLFIGAGLGDEQDLSRRAVEELRRARKVFTEEYTAVFPRGALERIAEEIGQRVNRLARPEVEGGRSILEALEGAGTVAFLTPGDPFAATTHLALRLAAEEAGHSWRYLPGASVLTAAAGLLGLIHYRFGRTVTVPFPEPNFDPASPWEWVARNRAAGLHTLVLLDLRPAEGRFLRAEELLARMASVDLPTRILGESDPVGVVARVGRSEAGAWWGSLSRLLKIDFGPPMHAVIVPAPELHFEEAAAVRRWRVP